MVYEVPSFTEAVTLQPGQQSLRLGSMESCPTQQQQEIELALLPNSIPLPSATGHGEEQRTHPEKHLNQVLSSIQINAAQESPPLGGKLSQQTCYGCTQVPLCSGLCPMQKQPRVQQTRV